SRMILVCADRACGREQIFGHTGPDDIDPIERRFCGDTLRIARIPQLRAGDHDLEVLAHLEAIPYLSHPRGNRRLTGEPTFGTRGGLYNRVQLALGRQDERLPLPRPLAGEQRVAT